MKVRNTFQAVAIVILSGLAMPASAHTGHGEWGGWLAGMAHPLGGLDHLLIMLGVGVWAGRQGGKTIACLPVAFLAMMAMGAAMGFAGLILPAAELWVSISVAVLGLLFLAGRRAALFPVNLGVAAFGLFHGFVHAQELPTGMSAGAYAAGFLLSTLLLLGLGACLARVLRQPVVEGRDRIFRALCGGVAAHRVAG